MGVHHPTFLYLELLVDAGPLAQEGCQVDDFGSDGIAILHVGDDSHTVSDEQAAIDWRNGVVGVEHENAGLAVVAQ